MKKKTKVEVKRTIIFEDLSKSMWVWVSGLVSLLLLIWTFFPQFYISTNYSQETCNAINMLIQGLSMSYISGIIFYFFSVFVPKVEQDYVVKTSLASSIHFLYDDVKAIMSASCEDKIYSDDFDFAGFTKRMIVEDVSKHCLPENESKITLEEANLDVHFEPAMLYSVSLIITDIYSELTQARMMSIHLEDPQYIFILAGLEHCRFFTEVMKRTGEKSRFSKDEVEIRFAMYKKLLWDYKFWRDGLAQMNLEYSKYYTL